MPRHRLRPTRGAKGGLASNVPTLSAPGWPLVPSLTDQAHGLHVHRPQQPGHLAWPRPLWVGPSRSTFFLRPSHTVPCPAGPVTAPAAHGTAAQGHPASSPGPTASWLPETEHVTDPIPTRAPHSRHPTPRGHHHLPHGWKSLPAHHSHLALPTTGRWAGGPTGPPTTTSQGHGPAQAASESARHPPGCTSPVLGPEPHGLHTPHPPPAGKTVCPTLSNGSLCGQLRGLSHQDRAVASLTQAVLPTPPPGQ